MIDSTIINNIGKKYMFKEIEKIIDTSTFVPYIEEKFDGVENLNEVIEEVKKIKIIELAQKLFSPQFALQEIWYEEELSKIQRKLSRCVTTHKKIELLEAYLSEQEMFFEEDQYFDLIDQFADAPFSEFLNKLKILMEGRGKTSRWLEMSNEEQSDLDDINDIQYLLPKLNDLQTLTLQNIRSLVIETPSLYRLFSKLMRLKKGTDNVPKLILNIIKDVFEAYYKAKLNEKLREEYKKLIPKSDYELVEIVEEDSSSRKISIALPKVERSANDKITSLTLDQTTYLFSLLREQGIILKEKNY